MIIFDTISILTFLKYGLIICLAAIIHGSLGIGFPLVATPLLSMFMDVRSAILILLIPTMTNNIGNVIRGGQWDKSLARYWPIAAYGIVGSFLGTRLLVLFSADSFRPLLGLVLILYLCANRLGFKFTWIRTAPRIAMALFGLLAGVLGGTVNIMLPVLVIYALEEKMDKTTMIQVFNFCFLLGKFTQGVVLFQAGFITGDLVLLSAPLAVIGVVVMGLGMKIRDRIKTGTYRKGLRYLLAIMSGILIVQFITSYV